MGEDCCAFDMGRDKIRGVWTRCLWTFKTMKKRFEWSKQSKEGLVFIAECPVHIRCFMYVSCSEHAFLMSCSYGFILDRICINHSTLSTNFNLSRVSQKWSEVPCNRNDWTLVSKEIQELRKSRPLVKSRSLWANLLSILIPGECNLPHLGALRFKSFSTAVLKLLLWFSFCSIWSVTTRISREMYRIWRTQWKRYY